MTVFGAGVAVERTQVLVVLCYASLSFCLYTDLQSPEPLQNISSIFGVNLRRFTLDILALTVHVTFAGFVFKEITHEAFH